MASWINRILGGRTNLAKKNIELEKKTQSFFTFTDLAHGGFDADNSSAASGFTKNPIIHRCVRMIAQAAARVPLKIISNGENLTNHPLMELLKRPNIHSSGPEILERLYSYLQLSGNAYLEAIIVENEVKALFDLRPDRMKLIAGKDGWPIAYEYIAGNKRRKISQTKHIIPSILHLKLFHPNNDYYGASPFEAAKESLEIFAFALQWNKALLKNGARPSGALVYSAASGNLNSDQFERLKRELENSFQGTNNAGRPMLLEGGLDWKTIALSPKDMDFIEAKNAAARDIALAFGVPPMLLAIPGDNTYANYAEANRAFWRQTILPLVRRVSANISNWLAPTFKEEVQIEADFTSIEAISEDRALLWKRISEANFLSDEEKREQLGIATMNNNR